jgi:hypothetical protein
MAEHIHTVRALIKVCTNRRTPELALEMLTAFLARGFLTKPQFKELKREIEKAAKQPALPEKPPPKKKPEKKAPKKRHWKYSMFFFSTLNYPANCVKCQEPIEVGRPAAVNQEKQYLHVFCTEDADRKDNPFFEKLKLMTRGVIEAPEDESS